MAMFMCPHTAQYQGELVPFGWHRVLYLLLALCTALPLTGCRLCVESFSAFLWQLLSFLLVFTMLSIIVSGGDKHRRYSLKSNSKI